MVFPAKLEQRNTVRFGPIMGRFGLMLPWLSEVGGIEWFAPFDGLQIVSDGDSGRPADSYVSRPEKWQLSDGNAVILPLFPSAPQSLLVHYEWLTQEHVFWSEWTIFIILSDFSRFVQRREASFRAYSALNIPCSFELRKLPLLNDIEIVRSNREVSLSKPVALGIKRNLSLINPKRLSRDMDHRPSNGPPMEKLSIFVIFKINFQIIVASFMSTFSKKFRYDCFLTSDIRFSKIRRLKQTISRTSSKAQHSL
jgi:hypothetical protein